MPRNGSGTYTLPQGAFQPNTTISSNAMNSDLSDIASALSQSISADGQTPITAPIKFFQGSVSLPGVSFASSPSSGLWFDGSNVHLASAGVDIIQANAAAAATSGNTLLNGFGAVLIPVATIWDWAGSGTLPAGWFLCAGQAINRTNYPELFNQIGTTYGVGDGSTTFNLPDARGRATYGKDNMGGSAAGRITVAGGNFDGTVLGGTGGQQNSVIAKGNLPSTGTFAVTIPGGQGGHLHAFPAAAAQPGSNSNGGSGGNASNGLNVTQTNAATLPSMNGTAAIGGSDTPLPVLGNAIIVNKIIFAGRP